MNNQFFRSFLSNQFARLAPRLANLDKRHHRLIKYPGSDVTSLELFIYYFLHVLSLGPVILMFQFLLGWLFSSLCLFIWRLWILALIVLGGIIMMLNSRREFSALFENKPMTPNSLLTAKRIKKMLTDEKLRELSLAKKTKDGYVMPRVYVYLSDDQTEGEIAIENIGTYNRLDRSGLRNRMSGFFTGPLQWVSLESQYLTKDGNYMVFTFEDLSSSHRLVVSEPTVKGFVSDNPYDFALADNLVWHSKETPHMTIVARTRSGKSVFAGGYLANLMIEQGWGVEYHSTKRDKYVDQFNGQYEPEKIVEQAETWVEFMKDRVDETRADDSRLTVKPVALFFDELGNLNASLEMDKDLKKRWANAIYKLTATGASAGIHVIAISQYASEKGLLPAAARSNCADAVIMLGEAANTPAERSFVVSEAVDDTYEFGTGQGLARVVGSGRKWSKLHFYETPWLEIESIQKFVAKN